MFRSLLFTALCLSFSGLAASAPFAVNLWPDLKAGDNQEIWVERGKGITDRAVSNVRQPTLTVYLPEAARANGAAIVIAPGGGFEHLAIDKEALYAASSVGP